MPQEKRTNRIQHLVDAEHERRTGHAVAEGKERLSKEAMKTVCELLLVASWLTEERRSA